MNATATDKKWFIYIVDHHEGPYTVEEIQSGVASGKLPANGFVWAQGMVDWLPINQVAEFHPRADLLNTPPVPAGPPDESARPVEERTKSTFIEIGDIERRDLSKPKIYARPAGIGTPTISDEEISREKTGAILRKSPMNSGAAKVALFLIALLSFGYGLQKSGMLSSWTEKVKDMMSSFPPIPDVEKEEYEVLKKAAKIPMTQGPAVAIAISKADPLSPQFYVASNLSDGAVLDVFAEGVGPTLLNTMTFSGKMQATVQKGVGKTQSLRYPDGKAIPRGEYTLYVMEAPLGQPEKVAKELSTLTAVARQLPANLPQDRRIVYSKRLFIGQKDASYLTRLKEFHEKIAQKASLELNEVKQLVQLLESQYQATVATYDRLKRQKISTLQMREWQKLNQTWRPLENQIKNSLLGATQEASAQDYYYSEYYQSLSATSKTVSDLHQTQEQLFQMRADVNALEPKVASLRSYFEAQFNALRSALEQVTSAAGDPNGFPAKIPVAPVPTPAPIEGQPQAAPSAAQPAAVAPPPAGAPMGTPPKAGMPPAGAQPRGAVTAPAAAAASKFVTPQYNPRNNVRLPPPPQRGAVPAGGRTQ